MAGDLTTGKSIAPAAVLRGSYDTLGTSSIERTSFDRVATVRPAICVLVLYASWWAADCMLKTDFTPAANMPKALFRFEPAYRANPWQVSFL